MTVRAASWLNDVKPTVFYGTPTYALHLADTALKRGIAAARVRIAARCSSPVSRARRSHRCATSWSRPTARRCSTAGSMAEMTPWMSAAGSAESSPGMLLWQDIVYTEVCDPKTFRRVPYGAARHAGVHASRAYLAADDPPGVGRSHDLGGRPDIPAAEPIRGCRRAIFGRIDDMFTIRGENVYPSEIDSVIEPIARLRRRASHRASRAKARWTSC